MIGIMMCTDMSKRFAYLMIVLWCYICPVSSKTYMVSVGVADYPGTKNDLKLSDHDALTMRNLYEKNCQADVAILINDKAKLSDVTRQMKSQFEKASKDDVIILYFSGHGIPGGFMCYNQILYYSTIYKIMSSSPARRKIVLADACFSGKARKAGKRGNVKKDVDVMFFLSSRTNEKSLEYRNWKNGVFTAYLDRGLRGGADTDGNRIITARELFKFVSEGVISTTKDLQHPVMWGRFDNELPVMIWK